MAKKEKPVEALMDAPKSMVTLWGDDVPASVELDDEIEVTLKLKAVELSSRAWGGGEDNKKRGAFQVLEVKTPNDESEKNKTARNLQRQNSIK